MTILRNRKVINIVSILLVMIFTFGFTLGYYTIPEIQAQEEEEEEPLSKNLWDVITEVFSMGNAVGPQDNNCTADSACYCDDEFGSCSC